MQMERPQSLAHFMTRRAAVSAILLVAVLLASQVLLQLSASRQLSDTHVIDLAGRQRMLNQRLVKTALSLQSQTVDQAARSRALGELRETLALWEQVHAGLQNGDAELALPGDNSTEVSRLFAEIEPEYQATRSAAHCLIAVETGAQPDPGCPSEPAAMVDTIQANEASFLSGMNAIVAQYTDEASARVGQASLFAAGLVGIGLVVIGGVWFLIVMPTIRRLQALLDAERETRQENERLLTSAQATNRAFQTVLEVSEQISTLLDVDRLLQDVVDVTKERFDLYHAHLYWLDDSGETLRLIAGAGHVGRQMVAEERAISMENEQSIVVTATRNRRGTIINDVHESETFLPHPLLPDTRSEMAVPLVARGQVLGVLDLQSDRPDFFSGDTLSVMLVLAGQVAAALSNAQLYQIAERSSRHERALGAIDRQIQAALNMDEVLQTTVRELGKALRVPHTAIELHLESPDELTGVEAVSVPSNNGLTSEQNEGTHVEENV